jgi:hypothetical protein
MSPVVIAVYSYLSLLIKLLDMVSNKVRGATQN